VSLLLLLLLLLSSLLLLLLLLLNVLCCTCRPLFSITYSMCVNKMFIIFIPLCNMDNGKIKTFHNVNIGALLDTERRRSYVTIARVVRWSWVVTWQAEIDPEIWLFQVSVLWKGHVIWYSFAFIIVIIHFLDWCLQLSI
jgi:hypothetical protein